MLTSLDIAINRLATLVNTPRSELDSNLIQDLSDTAAISEINSAQLVYRPWYVAATYLSTSDEVNLLKVESLQFQPQVKIENLLKNQARLDKFTIKNGYTIDDAYSAIDTLAILTQEKIPSTDIQDGVYPGLTVI